MEVEGVELTSPDKVLYPAPGLTKRDLATHYERVAERMLPFVADRPLTLFRCPDGVGRGCFFHKHVDGDVERGLVAIEVEERAGTARYRGLRDLRGLVALVQLGTLEIHLHAARRDRLDRPDRVVFDLDPGPRIGFGEIVSAARRVRDVLAERELVSFVMTTGGKGLHVVAPIERRHSFDELRDFARRTAERLVREDPERFVARSAKSERGGRIFIDWLRNAPGATAIAPYSTRAKPGAPVAVPLRWDEVGQVDSADAYRVDNLARRLSRLRADPWQGYLESRQRLP